MVKVAVTQHEPLWLDLDGSVGKACGLIEEAGRNDAELVVFPEVWIPGYPMWIWSRGMDPAMASLYIKNSLSYDSPQMARVCAAARESKVGVVLGFSENDNNSIYIAQCIISPAGEMLVKRRKLKPTHMERSVFGDGGGQSLFNVADVDGVGKVGALSCWEHSQPLLKYHTMSLREQIHVAAWPPLVPHDGGQTLYGMSAEGCQCLSRTFAMESAAFVLHCTSVLSSAGIDAIKVQDSPLFSKAGGGWSAVFGPDGRRLTEPIATDQEGFVFADLPLDMILSVRQFIDVVGHYSRPDLLWLGVDSREKKHVRTEVNRTQEQPKDVAV